MSHKSKNSFREITDWGELDIVLTGSDSLPFALYAHSAIQQLDVTMLLNEQNDELLLRGQGILSSPFNTDDASEIMGMSRALEFFVRLQKANQPALEAQVQALREEVEQLRELFQNSSPLRDDLQALDSESWAQYVNELQKEAKAAGGDILTFGRSVIVYYRCARLKLRSVYSSALLRSPYHSGQNHHIRFALPQDAELMRSCFRHDAKLYQELQAKTEPQAEDGDKDATSTGDGGGAEPDPAGEE